MAEQTSFDITITLTDGAQGWAGHPIHTFSYPEGAGESLQGADERDEFDLDIKYNNGPGLAYHAPNGQVNERWEAGIFSITCGNTCQVGGTCTCATCGNTCQILATCGNTCQIGVTCTCTCGNTCGVTCGNTCGVTCGNTCGVTCPNTCHIGGTCGCAHPTNDANCPSVIVCPTQQQTCGLVCPLGSNQPTCGGSCQCGPGATFGGCGPSPTHTCGFGCNPM
jgi:hypothetical protein